MNKPLFQEKSGTDEVKMESWKNKSTINTIRPRGSDTAKSRSSEHLKKFFQEKKKCKHPLKQVQYSITTKHDCLYKF